MELSEKYNKFLNEALKKEYDVGKGIGYSLGYSDAKKGKLTLTVIVGLFLVANGLSKFIFSPQYILLLQYWSLTQHNYQLTLLPIALIGCYVWAIIEIWLGLKLMKRF